LRVVVTFFLATLRLATLVFLLAFAFFLTIHSSAVLVVIF
jgi:hypothetical protein